MSAAPAGEWINLAAAFFSKRVDSGGKRLPYTACFNPAIDALIVDEGVPLEWRFLLWLYRQSWGNYSDFAVREKGGKAPLGQKDAAADIGTGKQRISEIVAYWRALGYLRLGTARALFPADSGIHPQKVRTVPDFHSPNFRLEFRDWWKVRYAADFEDFEVRRVAYFEAIKVRSAAVKEFEALRTPRGPILIDEDSKTFKGDSSSSLPSKEATTTNPEPEPPDFHSQHVATWEAAGKDGVPTPKQSATALRSLGSRSQEFLRWLVPKLNRVRHPGALPELTKEFLQTNTGPPMQSEVPRCFKCGTSLENGGVDGRCFNCAAENLPCLRE